MPRPSRPGPVAWGSPRARSLRRPPCPPPRSFRPRSVRLGAGVVPRRGLAPRPRPVVLRPRVGCRRSRPLRALAGLRGPRPPGPCPRRSRVPSLGGGLRPRCRRVARRVAAPVRRPPGWRVPGWWGWRRPYGCFLRCRCRWGRLALRLPGGLRPRPLAAGGLTGRPAPGHGRPAGRPAGRPVRPHRPGPREGPRRPGPSPRPTPTAPGRPGPPWPLPWPPRGACGVGCRCRHIPPFFGAGKLATNKGAPFRTTKIEYYI